MPNDKPTMRLHESAVRGACAELDRRLRAGEPCRAEDLLSATPALMSDDDAALEVVYTEYVVRAELGGRPDAEEWYARFPQWRERLQRLFQLHSLVRDDSSHDSAVTGDTPLLGQSERPFALAPHAAVRHIGQYEVLEELGRGGMGVVYKARQLGLNRLVALKMILAGPLAAAQDLARFKTEAEAVARLQHPNIVPIYEVGEYQGRPFLALEYVEGGSLDDALGKRPLPPREAAELAETLARAVQHAHERGIVHRDLKPANILLQQLATDEHGSTQIKQNENINNHSLIRVHPCSSVANSVPRITDFGLAKRFEPQTGAEATARVTRSGAIVGTPGYMAPEQARGAADIGPAADVHALGAILYECLTGRPPFQGPTLLDTLAQLVVQDPVPPSRLQPKVPPDLETICLKCLRKEPAKRYAAAGEMADDLGRFLRGEPIRARPVGSVERAAKWARRRPALAALLAVSAAAAVALLALWLHFTHELGGERDHARDQEKIARDQGKIAQAKQKEAEDGRAEAERQKRRAEAEKVEAERQRRRAEKEEANARRELDRARRSLLTVQMLRAAPLLDRQPAQARKLLDDPELCPPELRDFAWGYYRRLCDRGEVVLSGHTGPVSDVVYSPDGKTVATAGGRDSTARLWDAATGKELWTFREEAGHVMTVAFSPDGKTLAAGGGTSQRGTIHLLDAATGKLSATLDGHPRAVLALAFSPDGTALAAGSGSSGVRTAAVPNAEPGDVRLWDVAGRRPHFTQMKAHPRGTVAVAFAPDGKTLASAGGDQTVSVWDAASGKERASVKAPQVHPHTLAFTRDGRALRGVRDRAWVTVWEAGGGKEAPLPPRALGGAGVAVAADLRTFALGRFSPGTKDHALVGKVALMDLTTGETHATLDGGGLSPALAFSPDGATLAAGVGKDVKLWSVKARRVRMSFDVAQGISRLALSPDGRTVAFSSKGGLDLWDTATGTKRTTLEPGRAVGAVAFAPGSEALAVVSSEAVKGPLKPRPREFRLLEADTGRQVWSVPFPDEVLRAVAFAPDGQTVVTASEVFVTGGGGRGDVRFWDAATGKVLGALPGNVNAQALAFAADGKTLVTLTAVPLTKGGPHCSVRIWDAETGTEKMHLILKNAPLAGVVMALSPDARTLAVAGTSGQVQVWDVATGLRRAAFGGTAKSLAFSPDGRTLAVGSVTGLSLWDPVIGQERASLHGHSGQVGALAFSADGRLLVSGSARTINVWESAPPEPGGK